MRPWPVVAAIACAFLSGALPSTASAGWLPALPLDVSGSPSVQPAIGLAGDGRLGAAWQGAGQIRAATRPPGGSLEPGQIVSEAGATAFSPALRFDAAGNALLVWLRQGELQYMTRAAGTQAFGDLHRIAPSGESILGFELAVAPSGEAVLLWATIDTDDVMRTDYAVRAALRPPGGSFGPAQMLDSGSRGQMDSFGFDSLDVAIDAQGGAYATWASSKGSGSQTRTKVLAAVRAPGGSFGTQTLDERVEDPNEFVTPDASVSSPALASDAAGNALVVWQFRGGAKNDFRLQKSERSPGGTFGSFSNFGPPPSDAPMEPDVAISPDGRRLVAWRSGPDGAQTPQACLSPPGGACGAPQALSAVPASVSRMVAAIGASGHTLVAWQSATSVLASAGPPDAPLAIGELMASNATLGKGDAAVDPAGHGVVAYARQVGTVTEARVHDPVAPLITSFAPAPGGPALAPLAFAAAASDAWGPVSLTWDFGDGSSAPGPNAVHAYAGGGDYLARLTATDAGGNVAGRDAALTVTGSSADTTAPVIDAFSLTRRRFAVARGSTPISAARSAPRGSAFRVTTSEAATVTIAIQRRVRGRRLRGRCRPRARSGRRCTVYKGVGTLRRSLASGPRVIRFSGRIGRRALVPATYRARVVAMDGAGNRSKPRTATFTVVPAS